MTANVAAKCVLERHCWDLLILSWSVAVVSTLGALFIGEIMGQAPCNLCWFQRAFMFPLAVILGVACYVSDTHVWRYGLPIAALGWSIALYHSVLYTGILPAGLEPCGSGPSCSNDAMLVFGGVPIPLLSLAAFTVISIALVLLCRRSFK